METKETKEAQQIIPFIKNLVALAKSDPDRSGPSRKRKQRLQSQLHYYRNRGKIQTVNRDRYRMKRLLKVKRLLPHLPEEDIRGMTLPIAKLLAKRE